MLGENILLKDSVSFFMSQTNDVIKETYNVSSAPPHAPTIKSVPE